MLLYKRLIRSMLRIERVLSKSVTKILLQSLKTECVLILPKVSASLVADVSLLMVSRALVAI